MANLKEQLKLAALNVPPDILPKSSTFESYIGHNVIDLSNAQITEHQVSTLEKEIILSHSNAT